MADDLRTRIAVALYEASDEYTRKLMVNPRLPGCADVEGESKPVCYHLADAVIAALGLQIERGQRSKPDGPLWGSNNRYTVHRWVTRWESDVHP